MTDIELLRQITAYAKECGHDWLCLAEAQERLAQPEQPVPLNDVLIDAKNNILWLMRRLPKVYEEPPHVLRCIKEIDDALISAQPVLQNIEQYRLQMAAICTAAIGYWVESDDIRPDYDTLALRDVANLYAKYDALYKKNAQLVPLTDEQILEVALSCSAGNTRNFSLTFARAIEAAHGIKGETE